MKKKHSPNTRTQLLVRDGKKVRKHRWLMEQKLGRKLLPTEHVHHIDGNPLNNKLSNLVVMERRAHMQLHKRKHPDKRPCKICGTMFKVNPKKRGRSCVCSTECGKESQRRGRKRQVAEFWKNDRTPRWPNGRKKYRSDAGIYDRSGRR